MQQIPALLLATLLTSAVINGQLSGVHGDGKKSADQLAGTEHRRLYSLSWHHYWNYDTVSADGSCVDPDFEDNYQCQPGDTVIFLDDCDLTDDDWDAVGACLDNAGRAGILYLGLSSNSLTKLPVDAFQGLDALKELRIDSNPLGELDPALFDSLPLTVTHLSFNDASLTALPEGLFQNLGALTYLSLQHNLLTSLPAGTFDGVGLGALFLDFNDLTTLPAALLNGSPGVWLTMWSNPGLQCIPTNQETNSGGVTGVTTGICGCTPVDAVDCGEGSICVPGEFGYTCNDSAATCSNGISGIDGSSDNGDVCCPVECNQCGGAGCATSGAEQGLDNTSCCINGVLNSSSSCSDTGVAPCIVDDAGPTCSNGISGIGGSNDNGDVCCPVGCNQCGGAGCATSGAEQGLGNTACCINGVLNSASSCSDTGVSPCIIADDTGPTCSNGISGLDGSNDNGDVCCPVECNQCGGAGCATSGAEQGLDNTSCCINGVLNSANSCSDNGVAPCII